MNKLNGMSGQLFAVIAETINSRGTTRPGKGAGGQATKDARFSNLLHTVSNQAKRALNDQANESSIRPRALRAHAPQLAERDKLKDEAVPEPPEAAEEPNEFSALDHVATADIQDRPTFPSITGREFALVPASRSQAQPLGEDLRAAPERAGHSSTISNLLDAGPTKPVVGDPGMRASGAAPQGATAPPAHAPAPKDISAGTGFEAIAANIERVARLSGRDAVPETIKVSVLQQETHLPAVPQLTATQQVANAVVAELKSSSASASSAAADLVSAQSKAPDQPLKILTIGLDPPALGNVTVRLRLAGDTVSVHLAADRRDTSQLLEQQRDSIRELMRSVGYVADVAPVRHGTLDGLQAGSGQSQTPLSGQQQSSHGTPDNFSPSSGQPQGGAKQARQERHHDQEMHHEQDVVSHNRRGAVYL